MRDDALISKVVGCLWPNPEALRRFEIHAKDQKATKVQMIASLSAAQTPSSPAVPHVYMAAVTLDRIRHTASTSQVGGKESRTNCTPPIACLALSSALIAPWVEVEGTVT